MAKTDPLPFEELREDDTFYDTKIREQFGYEELLTSVAAKT